MAADITSYLDSVPQQNQTQPDFTAALTALLQGPADNYAEQLRIPGLFDLDTAVGAQLDVIGEWVGLSRQLLTPIVGVYFSLDDPDLGLDQGILQGPFDPSSGLTSLDDETYRFFLRLKIGANTWDGTFESAQQLLGSILVEYPTSLLFVIDNFDMTMTVGLAGTLPNALFLSLLVNKYLTLKPAAVGYTVAVTSVDGTPIFGLDVDNDYISGLDVGALGLVY